MTQFVQIQDKIFCVPFYTYVLEKGKKTSLLPLTTDIIAE